MMARCLLLLAMIAAIAATASAGGERRQKGTRFDARQPPVKDCTRLNGRFGYYGNPWCTATEQARWDRWSARQRWAN
jgi:hypothetical protein